MEIKKMKDYRSYIENLSQLKIIYFNEEIYCQVLKESGDFILVRDIKDWHYDAYMIFPKKYIKKVKYGKIEKCREKILPPLKKYQFVKEIDKVDLSNIKNIMRSLFECDQGICIENSNEKNYIFTVGKIMKIKNNSIFLREITLCGKYRKKLRKIKYKDITCLFYKDEYSTKLINYAERNQQ